jgi:hypothetical protein
MNALLKTISKKISAVFVLTALQSCGSPTDGGGSVVSGPSDISRPSARNVALLTSDLYAAEIGLSACGAVDRTAACAGGGTVRITGEVTCGSSEDGRATRSVNLSYQFSGCSKKRGDITTTITGPVSVRGDMSIDGSSTASESIALQSAETVGVRSAGGSYSPLEKDCLFAFVSRRSSLGRLPSVEGIFCGEGL